MVLLKKDLDGGGASAPLPREGERMLTKTDVHVRVLYPTAFTALGVDIKGGDVVLVKESLSVTLLANGWAELVEDEEKPAKKASK